MKKFTSYIISLISLSLLAGCQKNTPMEQIIVVEGWIRNSEKPVVLLHKAIGAEESFESMADLMNDKMISRAKVTISNGTESEIMYGFLSPNYIPPTEYTTANMVGEAGREYEITVEYAGKTLTAKTSVPYPVKIEKLDTMHTRYFDAEKRRLRLKLHWKDDPATEDYYALYFHYEDFNQYSLCQNGVFTDEKADPETGMMSVDVYPSSWLKMAAIEKEEERIEEMKKLRTSWFHEGEKVTLMLVHIDKTTWEILESYRESGMAGMFMPVWTNPLTNINGGVGYFAGMGKDVLQVQL